ncbi:MAG: hypothetical protein Q8P41_04895 [Pseudomonadota bacterium]|nr:hypothetical protein [Pseudomonadota bacterium]
MDRWKATSLFLAGVLLGGTGYAFILPARASNGTIRAERFEVVDTSGVVRASVGVTEGTGASDLRMYDAKGKERANLSVLAGGAASLYLFDADKSIRVVLETGGSAKGASSLYLFATNGQNVAMTTPENGEPSYFGHGTGFSVSDDANRPRGGTYLDAGGTPRSYGE